MTHFEYLSVAGSIVFALTVGRLVTAAPYVFNRNSFAPLFAAIYSGFFLLQLVLWWVLWEMHNIERWDFIAYILFIATPLAYYLCAYVLVSEDPRSISSWADHYSNVSRLFSGILAFAFLVGSMRAQYSGEADLSSFLVFALPTITVFLVAAIWPRTALHWLLAITLFNFSILRIIGSDPGAGT